MSSAVRFIVMCAMALGGLCRPPLVPGLNNIGRGVDLAIFTPKHQDSIDPGKGVKSFVVNLTCGGVSAIPPASCGNGANVTLFGFTYTKYDQVSGPVATSKATTDYYYFGFEDAFSFSSAFQEKVNGDALFGLISASEEVATYFQLVVQFNASLTIIRGDVSDYNAFLTNPFTLLPSPAFLASVARIPALWFLPANWPTVLDHIQYFGTHYIDTIQADGSYEYTAVSTSTYVHAAGDAELRAEAGADFLGLLSTDAQGSASAHASNDYLASLTMRQISCQGGNERCHNLNDTAAYDAWADSVKNQPWIVDARYTHNAMLLQGAAATTLADITRAYMAWKGLERFVNLVNCARARLAQLMVLPAPTCDYTVAMSCRNTGKTGDPQVLIPAMRSKAATLYNDTTVLHRQLTVAFANLTIDARITGWEANITGWTTAVKALLAAVYSQPVVLTVTTANVLTCKDTTPGCTPSSSCCWTPEAAILCPDVFSCHSYTCGTSARRCDYASPPIPAGLLVA